MVFSKSALFHSTRSSPNSYFMPGEHAYLCNACGLRYYKTLKDEEPTTSKKRNNAPQIDSPNSHNNNNATPKKRSTNQPKEMQRRSLGRKDEDDDDDDHHDHDYQLDLERNGNGQKRSNRRTKKRAKVDKGSELREDSESDMQMEVSPNIAPVQAFSDADEVPHETGAKYLLLLTRASAMIGMNKLRSSREGSLSPTTPERRVKVEAMVQGEEEAQAGKEASSPSSDNSRKKQMRKAELPQRTEETFYSETASCKEEAARQSNHDEDEEVWELVVSDVESESWS